MGLDKGANLVSVVGEANGFSGESVAMVGSDVVREQIEQVGNGSWRFLVTAETKGDDPVVCQFTREFVDADGGEILSWLDDVAADNFEQFDGPFTVIVDNDKGSDDTYVFAMFDTDKGGEWSLTTYKLSGFVEGEELVDFDDDREVDADGMIVGSDVWSDERGW